MLVLLLGAVAAWVGGMGSVGKLVINSFGVGEQLVPIGLQQQKQQLQQPVACRLWKRPWVADTINQHPVACRLWKRPWVADTINQHPVACWL